MLTKKQQNNFLKNLIIGIEELNNRYQTLKEHTDDLTFLYDLLNNYLSKQVLLRIINYWYNSDFETLGINREKNNVQYFDLDLLTIDDDLFANIGTYIEDTILKYIDIL